MGTRRQGLGSLAGQVGGFVVGLALALCPLKSADAQIGSARYSAIVIDARSGDVLISASADEPRYPASLTKMMTLYMVFEALRDGKTRLDSRVTMSVEAASAAPSKLGIPPGGSLSVEQAILALVTKSANDVAAALGEHIGGSNERFAQMMTMRARSLGMSSTRFRNASGLPDPEQVTTARDMATLGRRLFQDFPNRYHYFGTVHFAWGRAMIRNHNRMLGDYEGLDGIKTGFTNASGFNIVTSARRDGVRLIGATFGGSSWVERDRHMGALLDQGFARMGVAARAPSSIMAAAQTPARASANANKASQSTNRSASQRQQVAARAASNASRQQLVTYRAPVSPAAQAARRNARVEQGSANGSAAAAKTPAKPLPRPPVPANR